MSDKFYRKFEDKFRGSNELIKLRLQVYLPFIQPLLHFYPNAQALDLGCGRGEWLELLTKQGFRATGVDLDDGMLEAGHEKGFQVENVDALAYLKKVPDRSLCIVSGFHIVEHLPFDFLKLIVQETSRVLMPGGLLIFETPNPENISVSCNSFYIDPTHNRPIPSELLSFLVEFYGYERCKVLRLQENSDLHSEQNLTLMQVLNGASPDYAVVAQTQGAPLLIEALNPVFEKNYGLSLDDVAEKYREFLEHRLKLIETKAQQAETKAQQAETKAQQAETKAQQAETKAQQALEEMNKIYESKVWRITLPLRKLAQFISSFRP
jgi:SAM-dependent methyltransferase